MLYLVSRRRPGLIIDSEGQPLDDVLAGGELVAIGTPHPEYRKLATDKRRLMS